MAVIVKLRSTYTKRSLSQCQFVNYIPTHLTLTAWESIAVIVIDAED